MCFAIIFITRLCSVVFKTSFYYIKFLTILSYSIDNTKFSNNVRQVLDN